MNPLPKETRDLISKLSEAAQSVLDRDAEWAPSGAKNDCNCINLSRKGEREYENGECPHQRLRALLTALSTQTEGEKTKSRAEAQDARRRGTMP